MIDFENGIDLIARHILGNQFDLPVDIYMRGHVNIKLVM